MTILRGAELQAEAVRLAATGHRPAAIAALLGRRPGTIAAVLSDARAAGVQVPTFRPGPAAGSLVGRREAADARTAQMAAMRAAGFGVAEIAGRLGVTANAVSSAMSRGRRARATADGRPCRRACLIALKK